MPTPSLLARNCLWLALVVLAVTGETRQGYTNARMLSSNQDHSKPVSELSWKDFTSKYLTEGLGKQCRYDAKDFKPLQKNAILNLPFEVNWVTMGSIPPVKHQGMCKAAWAFAAVSAIEAHSSIVSGEPIRLFSTQQVLDCMGSNTLMNCGPGTPGKAYDFIQRQGGLSLRYLYRDKAMVEQTIASTSKCKYDVAQSGVQVGSGSKDLKPFDETALIQSLLTQGPLTVLMDGRGLKQYTGGIWDGNYKNEKGEITKCSSNPEDLNHVVLLVAVEWDENNRQYFTFQNSWGNTWGEEGFFRLYREVNICGITLCASYPRLLPY